MQSHKVGNFMTLSGILALDLNVGRESLMHYALIEKMEFWAYVMCTLAYVARTRLIYRF